MSGRAPVAALPMYEPPEIAWANDALWRRILAGLRARGLAAPEALTRGRALPGLWRDQKLVFGQTCGYPYMTGLRDQVVLIATPEYGFPGCAGASHCSLVVRAAGDARRGLADFRGAVAAINSRDSNTGMNLFRATVAPLAEGRAFFSQVVVTGSHAASLEAVASGRAAIAAIDCVTFGLLARSDPALADRVAVVAETPSSPGLPFIMSARRPLGVLEIVRKALFEALADPELDSARGALGLLGARVLSPLDYARVVELERAAAAVGYPELI